MSDKLTARDLLLFDKEARALILESQRRGARIRVSNKNHAIVYGPDGGSTAIPRHLKSKGRTSRNAIAAVERLFRTPNEAN